ncbi:hypothetical protein ACWM35_23120 [Neobacillus sp. K501]
MEEKATKEKTPQYDFYDVIKKAYEKGLTDESITLKRIIEDLKDDLQHMLIR